MLAAPSAQTLNPQVDLLAEINAPNEIHKPGTEASVDQSLRRAALQRYLDQVNTYETLLDPLANIMKMNLGGAPIERGGKPVDASGFGTHMAPLLPTALADIGATPAGWEQSTEAKEGKTRTLIARLRAQGKFFSFRAAAPPLTDMLTYPPPPVNVSHLSSQGTTISTFWKHSLGSTSPFHPMEHFPP